MYLTVFSRATHSFSDTAMTNLRACELPLYIWTYRDRTRHSSKLVPPVRPFGAAKYLGWLEEVLTRLANALILS